MSDQRFTTTEQRTSAPKTKRSSRARITEKDALYLAFLSKFPAADADAMSYLAINDTGTLGTPTGTLLAPVTITRRMRRLQKLGAVHAYRSPLTNATHYGATQLGYDASLFHGYKPTAHRRIDGLSVIRLEHYREIATVAARLISPNAHLREELHLPPLNLDTLVSENEMRTAYDQTTKALKDARTQGRATETFSDYRTRTAAELAAAADTQAIQWGDILPHAPALYTVAADLQSTRRNYKTVLQPDLAVHLDPYRRDSEHPTPKNLLIEVEISPKTLDRYEEQLSILAHEFASNIAYQRCAYFVSSKAIRSRLTEAARNIGMDSQIGKRLLILDIEHRTPRPRTDRLTVPAAVDVNGFFNDDDA